MMKKKIDLLRGTGRTYRAVNELDDGDVYIVKSYAFGNEVKEMTDKNIKVVIPSEIETLYGHDYKKFSVDHDVLESGLISADSLVWLQSGQNRWGNRDETA